MTAIVLNGVVLAVLLVVSLPVLRRLRLLPVVWTVLHLSILTMVFDTLMIRVGLYVFDPHKILGVHVWGAPLEDFAYAAVAGIGMPVLWTVLGPRRPPVHEGDARRPDGPTGSAEQPPGRPQQP